MRKSLSFLLFSAFWTVPSILSAEVRTMTMREAVALALKQNPEILIARYEQAKARAAVDVARDPFVPKSSVAVVGPIRAAIRSASMVSLPRSLRRRP